MPNACLFWLGVGVLLELNKVEFYKEGKIISSEEFTKLSYKPVVPDSTGEYNLNQVCDYVYPK